MYLLTDPRSIVNRKRAALRLAMMSGADAHGEKQLRCVIPTRTSSATKLSRNCLWSCKYIQRRTRVGRSSGVKTIFSGVTCAGGTDERDVPEILLFSGTMCCNSFQSGSDSPLALAAWTIPSTASQITFFCTECTRSKRVGPGKGLPHVVRCCS